MMEDEGVAHIPHPLIAEEALDQRNDNRGIDNAGADVHVRTDDQEVLVAGTKLRFLE